MKKCDYTIIEDSEVNTDHLKLEFSFSEQMRQLYGSFFGGVSDPKRITRWQIKVRVLFSG